MKHAGKPLVILLEDDHLQAGALVRALESAFPTAEIRWFSSEYKLRADFLRLEADPPKAIVLDVMARWAESARDVPPPPDDYAATGAWQRAGIRCRSLFRDLSQTQNVPILLYTIVDRSDLQSELANDPEWWGFLRKDAGLQPLISWVSENLLRGPPRAGSWS